MPRIPIEPDSRLVRPNSQRVEWAMFTIKRHYKNAVKMTARYVGAGCQCGRIHNVQTADADISGCFNLSGFSINPLYLAVPMASDRTAAVATSRSNRQWAELAYELFKADTHNEVCRLGIDPASDESIQQALLRPGTNAFELAARHPHPFGGEGLGRFARPTRRLMYDEGGIAPSGAEIDAIMERRPGRAGRAPEPGRAAGPATEPSGLSMGQVLVDSSPSPAGAMENLYRASRGPEWVAYGNPTTPTVGFTYLSADFLDVPAPVRPPQPAIDQNGRPVTPPDDDSPF